MSADDGPVCPEVFFEIAVPKNYWPLRPFPLVISRKEEPSGEGRKVENPKEVIRNELEAGPACCSPHLLEDSLSESCARKHRGTLLRGFTKTPVCRIGKEPFTIEWGLNRVQ